MTNEMAMEAPETTGLIALVKEYWHYILGLLTGLATIWGYLKLVHGKGRAFLAWLRVAIDVPNAIAQLRVNMVDRAEFDGLKANVQDIRVRISTETSARRALLQHSETAFFEADNRGRVLWVNAAYLSLVDRELHEVTENNWRNSIHDLDRKAAVDAWRMAVNDSTDYRFKFRISTDNSEFWVIAEALCTKDDLGNVLSFAGALRKIVDPRGYATVSAKE